MIEARNRAWDERQKAKKTQKRTAIALVGKPTQRLAEYEREIETLCSQNDRNVRRVAEILSYIKTDQLYLSAGYETLEDYCQRRWGWSAKRGYQLAEADDVIKSLPADVSTMVENERQTRALVPVKESARSAVVKRVIKSGEPVTAKAITEATKPTELKARKRKKKAPVVIDVEPEPPQPKPRIHDCPYCRCK